MISETGSLWARQTPARRRTSTRRLQVSVELLAGTTSVPDWRRKPGRPRSSWLRGVLKAVHLTAQEVWTAADDREGWRAQRPSADYAF